MISTRRFILRYPSGQYVYRDLPVCPAGQGPRDCTRHWITTSAGDEVDISSVDGKPHCQMMTVGEQWCGSQQGQYGGYCLSYDSLGRCVIRAPSAPIPASQSSCLSYDSLGRCVIQAPGAPDMGNAVVSDPNQASACIQAIQADFRNRYAHWDIYGRPYFTSLPAGALEKYNADVRACLAGVGTSATAASNMNRVSAIAGMSGFFDQGLPELIGLGVLAYALLKKN